MLYLFDLDDTLIEGYVKQHPYSRVEVLPGRIERIATLRADGHIIGIITNQGGIAFGYNTEDDARTKFGQALKKLGLLADTQIAVCYSDSRSKDGRYNTPADVARRKPSGAMIRELTAANSEQATQGVLFVGDRPEDEAAATDAGVPFQWAHEFFK